MANINLILLRSEIRQVDVKTARECWRSFRVANGWGPNAPLLSPPDANLKLLKDKRVVSYGLSLAQSTTAGKWVVRSHRKTHLEIAGDGFQLIGTGATVTTELITLNLCPFSTPACRSGCVAKSGKASMDPTITRARVLKTRFLISHPSEFVTLLAWEIDRARAKHGKALRVRLNTFSDIRWEVVAPWLLRAGGRRYVRFYDYTKDWKRSVPSNYRLTLSVSEKTKDETAVAMAATHPVAVVFSTSRHKALPATWNGLPVIDGDASDNRSDDPPGIIGLRAKGSMRSRPMGMVRAA